MTDRDHRRFLFRSEALAEDAFEVVQFRGVEAVSRPYEFDITLVSDDPEIDLRAVLRSPAALTILRPEEEEARVIHGVPARFEQLEQEDVHVFYRAVLAPRLWQAGLYRENQLFLDKTVPDVLEEILRQAALTGDDYELRLTRSYPQWEYICQYGETDLDFISRWMEREGIYYYFEQTEAFEKLIFTDSSSSHEAIPGGAVDYRPPSSLTARDQEVVRALICRQRMLPRRVILRDYNYRRPDLELRAEAEVDAEGRGDVYLYGEHFKTPEEGNELARIRAEEILCREQIFTGESLLAALAPGFLFELAGHYRDSCNRRFLLTELEHEGNQAGALFGEGHPRAEEPSLVTYVNRFSALPADVQYRPERTTPKPRFFGTMSARVDAAGDGQYAEIDDEGRYKVRLAFDQSDRRDGRASRWVRMAQPYAGADYGMHFPLHRDTEVLLTFVGGDPDRPIIAGSVPNPETASPVTSENQTQCMIRTGGGNQIHTEDSDGKQLIKLQTPTARSSIRIGAPNPGDGPTGVMIFTEGSEHVIVQGHRELSVDQTDTVRVTGERTKRVGQNENITITGGLNMNVGQGVMTTIEAGGETHDVTGGRHVFLQGEEVRTVSNGRHVTVEGGGETYTVSGGREVTVSGGDTHRIAGGDTSTITGVKSLTVNGTDNYTVNGPRTITVNGPEARNIALLDNIVQGFEKSIKLAAAIEIFMGFKNETKLSLGLEQKAIAISHAAVNLGKDGIKSDNGKIVLGERVLLDNRIARIFA